MPTQAELAEIGRKVLERQEKDKKRMKARNAAIRDLIKAHLEEFEKLLNAYS